MQILDKARVRLGCWGRQVLGSYGLKDLVRLRDFDASKVSGRKVVVTGSGGQFRLRLALLPGWYLVEIRVDLPMAHTLMRIDVETSPDAELHGQPLSLSLHSGRTRKRLIWIPHVSELRLEFMQEASKIHFHHFRLKRVTSWFAKSRMLSKLAGHDPRHSQSRRKPSELAGEALWLAYCRLFEARETDTPVYTYDEWLKQVEPAAIPSVEVQRMSIASWTKRPKFSILTPTWNTPEAALRACLDSVIAQTYPDWEMCIADDASTQNQVRAVLQEYSARDARILIKYRSENGHISAASNTALSLATGDFVALLDHDDTLAPHALFSVGQALQHRPLAKLIYSDEDKLDPTGHRCDPYFKPDDSPDLLYSQNYMAHLLVVQRELVEQVGGFRLGFEGSQDYDLLLRCIHALGDRKLGVLHIPAILYHWRMSEGSTASGHAAKGYATDAATRALRDHFAQQEQAVNVDSIADGLYRHRWPIPSPPPLVSLIIPTRDGGEVLRTCIESIVQLTTYTAYEIIVVDNQSAGSATQAYLEELIRRGVARVLRYDEPFNYSAINNYAAAQAKGSVLGLINDDVEVISPGWLDEMVSHALRPDIGCVGAKLLYPDHSIQHAGVVLGIGGVAGHPWKYLPRHSAGYFSRLHLVHNVSAVTGAVLVVKRELFDAVGGLDEVDLTVAFNDVDFCMKVADLGVCNLFTPFAELIHHESKTRGFDETPERQRRFQAECAVMQSRWGPRLNTDPYYNPNLTLASEDYSIAAPLFPR